MKRLVTYILMIIFFFACNNPKPSSEKIIIFPDTTSIIQLQQQLEKSDTLIRELNIASITLQKQVDSLRCANDSIITKLFLSEHRVERVRYYLNITLRNPSQKVFLQGWIKRAIE